MSESSESSESAPIYHLNDRVVEAYLSSYYAIVFFVPAAEAAGTKGEQRFKFHEMKLNRIKSKLPSEEREELEKLMDAIAVLDEPTNEKKRKSKNWDLLKIKSIYLQNFVRV